jgi:hypothetical protein
VKEVWKCIPGYCGLYTISTNGSVKSMNRFVKTKRKNTRGIVVNEKILNEEIRVGYPSVTLCKNGNTKKFVIHFLVLLTFVGPRPRGKQINHIDGNTKNNKLTNLEYVTQSENILHSYRVTKTRWARTGELSHRSKLKTNDVLKIKKLLRSKRFSYGKIAEMFFVSTSAISSINRKRTWKHLK